MTRSGSCPGVLPSPTGSGHLARPALRPAISLYDKDGKDRGVFELSPDGSPNRSGLPRDAHSALPTRATRQDLRLITTASDHPPSNADDLAWLLPGRGREATATIRRVLVRHGGKIWLESEPGKGSRFFVSLSAQAGGTRGARPDCWLPQRWNRVFQYPTPVLPPDLGTRRCFDDSHTTGTHRSPSRKKSSLLTVGLEDVTMHAMAVAAFGGTRWQKEIRPGFRLCQAASHNRHRSSLLACSGLSQDDR